MDLIIYLTLHFSLALGLSMLALRYYKTAKTNRSNLLIKSVLFILVTFTVFSFIFGVQALFNELPIGGVIFYGLLLGLYATVFVVGVTVVIISLGALISFLKKQVM